MYVGANHKATSVRCRLRRSSQWSVADESNFNPWALPKVTAFGPQIRIADGTELMT